MTPYDFDTPADQTVQVSHTTITAAYMLNMNPEADDFVAPPSVRSTLSWHEADGSEVRRETSTATFEDIIAVVGQEDFDAAFNAMRDVLYRYNASLYDLPPGSVR